MTIKGMLSLSELVDELEILQGVMRRHGFDTTFVRFGVVAGKFSFLSGSDAEEDPSEEGYWSCVSTLTADDDLETIRWLANKLSSEVLDSHALQTSYWGSGTGVVAVGASNIRVAN
jgi:hypothetical protein